MDDFIYNFELIDEEKKQMISEMLPEVPSDSEIQGKIARMNDVAAVNDSKNKAEVILWFIKKYKCEKLEWLDECLKNDRKSVMFLLLFYWQYHLEDNDLKTVLLRLLEKEYDKIYLDLKQWLYSENTAWIIAKNAFTICKKDNITHGEFCFRYHIIPDSELGMRILNIRNNTGVEESMNIERVTKISMNYRKDNTFVVYNIEKESGINQIEFPKFVTNPKITIYTENGDEINTKYETLKSLVENGSKILNDEERKELSCLIDGENFNRAFEITTNEQRELPNIIIKDITENILLGFEPLKEAEICGKTGIWSNHGIRIFEIKMNSSFDNIDTVPKLEFAAKDNGAGFSFDSKVMLRREDKSSYYCLVDTDKFGAVIASLADPSQSKVTFEGKFSIEHKLADDALETYVFSFLLTVNNCNIYNKKNKESCINRNAVVSIDFGTSSTCAALDSNTFQLIQMTEDSLNESASYVYENPTNLRIFNWDLIKEKWLDINTERPVLSKEILNTEGKSKDTYKDFNEVMFDYGNNVKRNAEADMATLESIITELKMIPKYENENVYNTIIPYHAETSTKIYLVCAGEEDHIHFDPIAFYCYLLGCAINHPNGNDNQFYTKYILTFPVKFDKEIKNNLFNSIKKGILRSIPKSARELTDDKNRNMIKFEMKYSEPVACAGALCGYEIQVKDDGSPALFAIFDFGGGTIDFSFGMFRNADEEKEDYSEALELFGTDGDESFGGELLIRKISYWILMDNKETVAEKKILFELPSKDEKIPDGLSSFINSSQEAKANMHIINEDFSRSYFENYQKIKDSDDSTDTKITLQHDLYCIDGMTDTPEFMIHYDLLEARLKEEIERICKLFKNSMENVFKQKQIIEEIKNQNCEYNFDDVTIIMSGNASKHPLVKECLAKQFENNKIVLVGEEREDDSEKGNRYKVTPKTAVAIGAVKLNHMLVKMPDDFCDGNSAVSVSQLYIARENKRIKEILISRNETDCSWKRVGKINSCEARIFYSGVNDINTPELWKSVILEFDDDDDGKICYIRLVGADKIEYGAAESGDNPENGETIRLL